MVGQMPLDSRQIQEILLTGAQSIFAVAILMNLKMHLWEAGSLFFLFAAQLVFPEIRLPMSYLYFILASILLIHHRRQWGPMIREGLLNRKS